MPHSDCCRWTLKRAANAVIQKLQADKALKVVETAWQSKAQRAVMPKAIEDLPKTGAGKHQKNAGVRSIVACCDSSAGMRTHI